MASFVLLEPVPGITGMQVCDWATHHGTSHGLQAVPPRTWPESLLDEVRRLAGPQIIVPVNTHASEEALHEARQLLLDRVDKKVRLCRSLLSRDRFDLVVIGFSETDPASHAFWDQRPEAEDAEVL